LFRRNSADCVALLAACAGAGLATAFNAPFAGAIFVLEELLRRFDARSTIATLAASAGAIAVARLMLGHATTFSTEPLPHSEVQQLPLFLLLGLLAVLLGVAYNNAIVGALRAARALPRLPVELRAGAIGALVAAVACFAPALVGGGDALTQGALAGAGTLGFLALVSVVRFALGSFSYAAETPGGLFAPLLALGAVSGLAFGHLCAAVLPDLEPHPTAFAAVGMAALFTAMIRAPVTGIILTIEMTGLSTQFLPMLTASAVAMLVPQVLRAEPIYDTLRRMVMAAKRAGSDGP
jgi:CIC family chloride channel protein